MKEFVFHYATYNTPPTDPPPTDPPTDPPADPPKNFTQEQINRLLAAERRKLEAKYQPVVAELETLRTTFTGTKEERGRLEQQLEALRTAHLSETELAKRKEQVLKEQAAAKEAEITAERDRWRNSFFESRIGMEISSAGVQHKAFSTDQLLALLKPSARLTDVLGDDGKPTGQYEVKVKFPIKDSAGKETLVDMSVEDAVKAMKELPDRYGNLFRSDATSGLGLSNTGRTGTLDFKTMSPDEYLALRKKGQLQ